MLRGGKDGVTEMKASVISLHRVGNYGSVLQSVATRRLLESAGLDVEFIDYWRPDQIDPAKWASAHSRYVVGPITKEIHKSISREYFGRFPEVFHDYVDRNLPLTQRYESINELRDHPPSADLYVVGSDQVWNTDYNIGGSDPYFLSFGASEIPRISLASSIGKHPLGNSDKQLFRRALSQFSWISVREDLAQQDLAGIGIDAEVVPDPTLLLPPDVWKSDSALGSRLSHSVVLYALNRGSGIRARAKHIAQELGVPLVTISPRPLPWVRYQNELRLPPVSQFVEALANAAHVVTDSFHATAFCLNLGTPFTAVMPPKYSSRLDSILRLTGTESRNAASDRYSVKMPASMSSEAQDRIATRRDEASQRIRSVLDSLSK